MNLINIHGIETLLLVPMAVDGVSRGLKCCWVTDKLQASFFHKISRCEELFMTAQSVSD